MNEEFTFKCKTYDDFDNVVHEHKTVILDGCYTHSEVAECLTSFLKGCGYVFAGVQSFSTEKAFDAAMELDDE